MTMDSKKKFFDYRETGVFDSKDETVREEVLAIAKELQGLKKFVDTKNYKLRCNVCYTLLKGNEDAVSHGKSTGHSNFVQLD